MHGKLPTTRILESSQKSLHVFLIPLIDFVIFFYDLFNRFLVLLIMSFFFNVFCCIYLLFIAFNRVVSFFCCFVKELEACFRQFFPHLCQSFSYLSTWIFQFILLLLLLLLLSCHLSSWFLSCINLFLQSTCIFPSLNYSFFIKLAVIL